MDTHSILVDVTPEQAQKWIEDCNYPRQRPLRKWHVNELSEEIQQGRFIPGTSIHFVAQNGMKVLVNGQHTLSAIAQSGKAVPLTVVETRVEDPEEIARIYYRYDTGLHRSSADAFTAFGLAEKTGFTKMELNRLSAAMKVIYLDFGAVSGRMSRDNTMLLLNDWAPEMHKYLNAIEGCGISSDIWTKMCRSTTAAIALVTIRHYPDTDKALFFWRNVAMDDGLRIGDPAKTLHNWLLASQHNTGRNPNKSYTAEKAVRYVAQAWNAYVGGKELTMLYVRKASLRHPIMIQGTPWDGKEEE